MGTICQNERKSLFIYEKKTTVRAVYKHTKTRNSHPVYYVRSNLNLTLNLSLLKLALSIDIQIIDFRYCIFVYFSVYLDRLDGF